MVRRFLRMVESLSGGHSYLAGMPYSGQRPGVKAESEIPRAPP